MALLWPLGTNLQGIRDMYRWRWLPWPRNRYPTGSRCTSVDGEHPEVVPQWRSGKRALTTSKHNQEAYRSPCGIGKRALCAR